MSLNLNDFRFGITSVFVVVTSDVVIASGEVDTLTGDEGVSSVELHVDVSPQVTDFGHFGSIDSNLEDSSNGRGPEVFVITGGQNGDWIQVFPEFKDIEESLSN